MYTTFYPTYPVAYSSTSVVYTDPYYYDTYYSAAPAYVEAPAAVAGGAVVDPSAEGSTAYVDQPAVGNQTGSLPSGETPERASSMPTEEAARLLQYGVETFAFGQYDEAAKAFFEVSMADANNVDAALAYAVSRFATGDYSVAAVAVRRGVRQMPGVVNSLFDIRDRYGRLNDYEAHRESLDEFVSRYPQDVDGLVLLGFVQHFTAQRDEGAKTFEKVKSLSPQDADVADVFINAMPLEELLEIQKQVEQEEFGSQPASEEQTSAERNDLKAMETVRVRINEHTFDAWLAADAEQQRLGLMNVTESELAPIRDYSGAGDADIYRGMLFVFAKAEPLSFWMRNTITPLDVAFIREDGVILNIHAMAPGDEREYASDGPACFAFEVRAGTFERLGIEAGDRAYIPASLRATVK